MNEYVSLVSALAPIVYVTLLIGIVVKLLIMQGSTKMLNGYSTVIGVNVELV